MQTTAPLQPEIPFTEFARRHIGVQFETRLHELRDLKLLEKEQAFENYVYATIVTE